MASRAVFGRYGPSQPQWLRGVAWASSMSAIHRGIHRSNRNGPPRNTGRQADSSRDGRENSRGPRESSHRGNDRGRVASTSDWAGFENQAVVNPREPRRLSEKRRAEIVDGPSDESLGRMSRRKRFNDPRSSFGKDSMVYRMKFGDLKEKADSVHAANAERVAKPERLPSEPEHPRGDVSRPTQGSDVGWPRRGTGGTTQFFQDSRYGRLESQLARDWARGGPGDTSSKRNPFEQLGRDAFPGRGKTRFRSRRLYPISIKYTTAASQFLYGKSVVKAALISNRRRFYNFYILEAARKSVDFKTIKITSKVRGVNATMLEEEDDKAMLDKMSEGRPHNGYVLEASPLPQPPITALGPLDSNRGQPEFSITLGHQTKEEILINGTDNRVPYYPQKGQKPLVLFLYEVVDPGNLGALLRTAKFLGVSAIVTTKENSAGLTPVVLKASAGAAEEMPMFTVQSAVDFLKASREAGWRSYAAAPPSTSLRGPKQVTSHQIEELNPLLNSPCILILGSEGQGLPTLLRRATDYEVNIPMATPRGLSTVSCLNVSAAGAILCNAFLKIRRRKAGSQQELFDESEEIDELGMADKEVLDVGGLEGSTAGISLNEETDLEEPVEKQVEESTEEVDGQGEEVGENPKEAPKPDQSANEDRLF